MINASPKFRPLEFGGCGWFRKLLDQRRGLKSTAMKCTKPTTWVSCFLPVVSTLGEN